MLESLFHNAQLPPARKRPETPAVRLPVYSPAMPVSTAGEGRRGSPEKVVYGPRDWRRRAILAILPCICNRRVAPR